MSRSASSRIAVVTNSSDEHVSSVEKYLEKPLLLLNVAEAAAAGVSCNYHLNSRGNFRFSLDGRIPKDITTIWYRRTSLRRPDALPVPPNLRNFASSALETMEKFLWLQFKDARWVSDPFAMTRATDKLWQLEAAAQLGFCVPKTLVTSSPQAAKEFVRRTGPTITKTVGVRYFIDDDGNPRVVLTRKVDPNEDFDGLNLAPTFFQQALDVAEDIRVTVVGDKVFAAAIRGSLVDDPSSPVRDWRMANFDEHMDIRAFDLPKKLAKQCADHVRAMGLSYGAIDLILDKKGVFWFLEDNPDGQWLFIENVTRQPISQAVAELLAAP